MEQKSHHREIAHTKELSGDGWASEQLILAEIRELTYSTTLTWTAAIPLFVKYGYAQVSFLCFPLVMLSASHWLLAQARFCSRTHLPPSPNSTTSTGQGDIPISLTGCTCFNIHRIHSTWGHGDISAITLLILSLSGCSCLNINWYTVPVDMMTFRWSRRSYQSICQQHPLYSHSQVTLIYYIAILWFYVIYTGHSLGVVWSLCRDAVGVFSSPNQLGWYLLEAHFWIK